MISNYIDKLLHHHKSIESNICLINLQNNNNNNNINNKKINSNNNTESSSSTSSSLNKSSTSEINRENDENYFETIQHLNYIFNIYKYNGIMDLENSNQFIDQFIKYFNSKKSQSIIFTIDQQLNLNYKSAIRQLIDQLPKNTKVIFLFNGETECQNQDTSSGNVIIDPSKSIVNKLELYNLNKHWFIYSSPNSDDLKTQGLYWLTQNL